ALQYAFFFQAEDGIRDGHVTGVQTCALPIFADVTVALEPLRAKRLGKARLITLHAQLEDTTRRALQRLDGPLDGDGALVEHDDRSEERRVGKECRCRWVPNERKKELS